MLTVVLVGLRVPVVPPTWLSRTNGPCTVLLSTRIVAVGLGIAYVWWSWKPSRHLSILSLLWPFIWSVALAVALSTSLLSGCKVAARFKHVAWEPMEGSGDGRF